MFRFKLYLINEVEKILTARPYVFDDSIKRVKIVDAVFAFKNSTFIKLLKDRGTAII